jgi:hypothetical protein
MEKNIIIFYQRETNGLRNVYIVSEITSSPHLMEFLNENKIDFSQSHSSVGGEFQLN